MADEEKKGHDLAAPLAGMVVAGGTAVGAAAIGATGAGVVIALLAMFPGAVQLAVVHAANAQRRRAQRLWDEFMRRYEADATPAEAAGFVEAHASEPFVYETVTASVRSMLDAVSEEVVPALGALTASYVRDEVRPDGFFRGFARVLVELSATEYEQLKMIAHEALRTQPSGPDIVNLQFIGAAPGEQPCACLARWEKEKGEVRTALGPAPDALRLFQLLKVNGLGRDNPGGFADGGLTGPQVVLVEHDVMQRLGKFLV